MSKDNRSYVGGNFMFELDGVKCGFLKSVGGGAISATVVNEPTGPDLFVKKHIALPKFEDFELGIGFSMSKPVYEWIQASWKQNFMRKNGAVISADRNMNARSVREFTSALITEVGIPTCDGSSKDPAYVTVKLAPEDIVFKDGSGKIAGEIDGKQKDWLPSNFRLEIPGLDCSRVNKVDGFTIKQTAVDDDIGDGDGGKEPGKLEFPGIRVYLAEAASQTWIDYFESFVIRGNNTEDQEKNGTLVFLSPNRERELVRINFFNMGIHKFGPEKSEANDDKIKRVSAELYVERMELDYK
jgi:hypothetical protein